MTTGWKLDHDQRSALLARHPPRYAQAVADHVTLLANHAGGMTADPPEPVGAACIVGHADDGAGVEAMVVTIDGTTDRPDGSTFHITWSLADGRRARESNDVLRDRGWAAIDPVPVTVTPARF